MAVKSSSHWRLKSRIIVKEGYSQFNHIQLIKMSKLLSKHNIQYILGGFLILGSIYVFLLLPSMSNGFGAKTVVRAKQAEAKVHIKYMNQFQRAYRLESGLFTTDIAAFGIRLLEQNESYVYSIVPSIKPATRVTHLAVANQPGLRSYIGEVAVTSRDMTVSIVCESQRPSQTAPLTPEFVNGSLVCASGSIELK